MCRIVWGSSISSLTCSSITFQESKIMSKSHLAENRVQQRHHSTAGHHSTIKSAPSAVPFLYSARKYLLMLGSCIAGLSLWFHGKKKACSFLKEWFFSLCLDLSPMLPVGLWQPHIHPWITKNQTTASGGVPLPMTAFLGGDKVALEGAEL